LDTYDYAGHNIVASIYHHMLAISPTQLPGLISLDVVIGMHSCHIYQSAK